ncbi:MAG TPA: methyltransferase type 11, partial [Gammaproteobacteria bacterium]|nr:methyltransferase type 11 [Gammaproteobacteria bacterium]
AWNLTAKTIMSVDEWVSLFDEAGYTGDYYWFIP